MKQTNGVSELKCNPTCQRQVTQFLLEIFGLEVPSLGWLIDNKMSLFYAEALMKNDVKFVEMFPVPVIVLNSDGTIRCANTGFCKIKGKSTKELEGKQYLQMVLNNKKYDENGRYLSTVLLSLETEQEFYRKYTSIYLDDSGGRTRYEVSTRLLRDEKGSVTGVCGVLFELDEATELIKNLLKTKIQLLTEKPEVIYTLNKMTAELDPLKKQYLQNVSQLAVELAEWLGLNENQMDELRSAATLHNIGVVGIPKNIYLKNECLTDEEIQILKNHPRIAYELFEGVPQFEKTAKIILYHHENYDGSGYPCGLKGEDIPIESRIIAIIETYVHLTTKRTYRKTVTVEEALTKIEKSSGTRFDPSVVAGFSRLIREKYLVDTGKINNQDRNATALQHEVKIYEMYTLIRFLNKMLEERVGEFARSIDLTVPQVHLMTMLCLHEGLLVSEIARLGAWHISTVMSILSRLVKKGLIRYEPVEKGKGTYVFLTDTGKASLEKFSDLGQGLVNILPPQKLDNNLTQLYAVLEKYYDRSLMDQLKEHFFYAHRAAKLN